MQFACLYIPFDKNSKELQKELDDIVKNSKPAFTLFIDSSKQSGKAVTERFRSNEMQDNNLSEPSDIERGFEIFMNADQIVMTLENIVYEKHKTKEVTESKSTDESNKATGSNKTLGSGDSENEKEKILALLKLKIVEAVRILEESKSLDPKSQLVIQIKIKAEIKDLLKHLVSVDSKTKTEEDLEAEFENLIEESTEAPTEAPTDARTTDSGKETDTKRSETIAFFKNLAEEAKEQFFNLSPEEREALGKSKPTETEASG